jgi:hypothetical protein
MNSADPRRTLGRSNYVLIIVFLLSLPAVTTRIYASDEIEYFAYLRSLWFDRDLSFENEYRYFYDAGIARSNLFRETFLERRTPTGLRLNFAPMGCAIMWAPFYAAGDVAARLLNAAGHPVAVDGYSWPYIAAICYGSAIYGLLALLIATRIASRLSLPPLAGTLAVWLGTPLLFYMYVAPPMSHAVSAFMVAVFVLAWLNVRRTWSPGGVMLLGALAALMTMVREQDLFVAAGPALDLCLTRLGGGSGQSRLPSDGALFRNLAAGALTFAVVFLPQAAAYLVLNGRLGPPGEVERKMIWTAPHFFGVLLSPEHGFFFWTPLAIVALAGLVFLARRATDRDVTRIGVCALVMVLAQIYIAGSVESWTVAGAFGQRRFLSLTVLLAPGVAAAIQWARRSTARVLEPAVWTLVAVCVWWNIGLMAQFGSGTMDRQRLELSRNAYYTFVVFPLRVPSLARRYLLERETFYKSHPPPAQSRP